MLAAVVFAETRGKAKLLSMKTDACEDADFINIEARRMKAADRYYKEGKTELEWNDPADRLVLVKECGFTCDYDAFGIGECEGCSAQEYCEHYKDLNTESEE